MNAIDAYIASAPIESRSALKQLRKTIKQLLPKSAEEVMSYGIPTFDLDGMHLVHYAGYKNHVGFYPGPDGVRAFKKDFQKYKHAKGSVQFPLDAPLPLTLIKKVVVHRLSEVRKQKK